MCLEFKFFFQQLHVILFIFCSVDISCKLVLNAILGVLVNQPKAYEHHVVLILVGT